MKFGIMLPHYRPVASTEAIAKMAKRAEELGFDSVWVTDLIAVPNIAYDRFGPIFYEATTVLSYVAGITNTVRLGGSVFALPFRNAIHMAKIAASIDALSHGRLILGVGVAGAQSEMLEMGVRDDGRGMKRGERADEALRIFQEVWTSDNPSVNTENYLISDFQMLPKPVQKPGIPHLGRRQLTTGPEADRRVRGGLESGQTNHRRSGGDGAPAEENGRSGRTGPQRTRHCPANTDENNIRRVALYRSEPPARHRTAGHRQRGPVSATLARLPL